MSGIEACAGDVSSITKAVAVLLFLLTTFVVITGCVRWIMKP